MNPSALAKSVAVIRSSGMQGTGFFLSPRLLVTAGHVIASVGVNERVSVSFLDQAMEATVIDKRTDATDPVQRLPFPDVALLQFADTVGDVKPLPLTEVIPATGASVYSRGFPVNGEAGGEHAVATVEGTRGVTADTQRFRVKLSAGQFQPGMSGAPAVLANGCVAGVITLTRDEKSDLGGFFTPTIELVRAFGISIPDFVVASETVVTVPPLPDSYLERADVIADLRQALTTERTGRSIAMIALQGMAGLGKTLLAQAICHDNDVRKAFPDGIVWLPMGKESTRSVATLVREVERTFGEDLPADVSDLSATGWYRAAVRYRAALIVLDDVWSAGDLEPFRAESPRSRLLFTTRNESIARDNAAQVVTPGFLLLEQCGEMLARWSKIALDPLQPEVSDIIEQCGGLPLALAMIGAMMGEEGANWKDIAQSLREARLTDIQAEFSAYPYPDLLRALQVSVEALDPKRRECYFKLAVMLEDMPIHPLIQQVLWNAEEAEARNTAKNLTRLALAQRAGREGSIRLHDLLLVYVRAQYPDRNALDVIHAAMRLSSNIIERDPTQFASQLVGRLLPYLETPAVHDFIEEVAKAAPRPWLHPRFPALEAPGTGLLRTIEGHTAAVAVVVTLDGRRAVSGSADKTLKVWDLESGRDLQTLEGHAGEVWVVAVTPDGRRAVSACSEDKTLKVWDLESGRALQTSRAGTVWALAVTPDGRRAVSGSGTTPSRSGTLRAATPCRPSKATLTRSAPWR